MPFIVACTLFLFLRGGGGREAEGGRRTRVSSYPLADIPHVKYH